MTPILGRRRRSVRVVWVPLALLFSMTIGAASAGAAQRYAAPGGGLGPACPQGTPCNIEVAIEGAANGDEVIVQPGVLAAGANEIIAGAPNLVIHGASASAKPEITSTTPNTALNVTGTNVTVRNLKLTHTGLGGVSAGLLLDASSTAEQIEVTSVATFACGLTGGSTIRDSTCRSTTANSGALAVLGFTSAIGYARNITAVATGTSSGGVLIYAPGSGVVELDARNVIAQGSADVLTFTSGASVAKATMTYSGYATTQALGTGTSTITPAGTANNITALPQFVNAAFGDYRQLAGSPTRNAGATDSRTGTLDFEGEARPQAAIDIGADEFTEPAVTPPPPPSSDTTAPATTIDKGPRKKSKSKKATFRFSADEAGSTFECKLDKGTFEACASPTKYKRLKKGKHTFAVQSIDAAGNTDASPAIFNWKIKKKRKK